MQTLNLHNFILTVRFARERYNNPPFKVNAKIRTVYTQEVTTIEGQGHNNLPNSLTCHQQTQTEPLHGPDGKAKAEAIQEVEHDDTADDREATKGAGEAGGSSTITSTDSRVDASTSPIPPPYFPASATTDPSTNPFAGCSQMTVYPPLNYVRKLEDLEKITGHIVIQRFFTRTDDVFGSWLEKQLGMTSKSVSVDTSEFENAKTAELRENDQEGHEACQEEDTDTSKLEDEIIVTHKKFDNLSQSTATASDFNQAGTESEHKEERNQSRSEIIENVDSKSNHCTAECGLADHIKCECYLDEGCQNNDDSGIEQVPDEESTPTPNNNATDDLVENVTVVPTDKSKSNQSENNEQDIDEVVRCTLEAYLLAPLESEDMNEVEEESQKEKGRDISNEEETDRSTPVNGVKSEIDSGRADSIRSHEKTALEDIEGNTSHDSVETVFEICTNPLKLETDLLEDENKGESASPRILQRSLSADSCIGTESSGDAKNQTTNASQSSNDTIEGIDPIVVSSKELVDLSLGSPASAPPAPTKLPSLATTAKAMTMTLVRRASSGKSQRSNSPCSAGATGRTGSRRNEKTDAEGEDADGESETESEIMDNFLLSAKLNKQQHHQEGTDLELEEVDEDEGGDDDRDAFDTMVANHLKYSRGLPTAARRSKLNRGTQTTKSIEPSTTSGSVSPCSSSNSSFDVEIISKSKRITTTSSSAGGTIYQEQQDMITPSNMTLAWHEGGRRRSYLPNSSSSLNLLNMKFSLGKDFESEVSIRMPTTNNTKSSTSNNTSATSMLLPGSGATSTKPLMSGSRMHHHNYYQGRGLSPASQPQQHHPSFPPPATTGESTELQSLWKDVRTKLDVQMDEMVGTIQEEPEDTGLQVRGNGILPAESAPTSATAVVKLKKNEERIKKSLQKLKKILDD